MAMAATSLISASTWLSNRTVHTRPPTASISLLTKRSVSSRNATVGSGSALTRSGLLHCSFVPSASSALSFPSSVSGLGLGLNFNTENGGRNKRRGMVITAAGRQALCLTKRSRSRKSLARTHGFRVRMSTTAGRAVLKRRRAKGRKILCTKTNPNSGKR